MLPASLVLATGNAAKQRELRELLAPWAVEVLPQAQFTAQQVEETGLTFVENAILKARHAAHAAGLPAIADDSGLEVDALQGAPGVHSARFAGAAASDRANLEKLLAALAGMPEPARTARYRCAMVYLRHAADPSPLIAQAQWDGRIATSARGEGGFGYDPIFLVGDGACTAAELDPAEKHRVSHRGLALRALVAALAAAPRAA